jgi:hypothetical protein
LTRSERVGNDNEARWRQIPDLYEIAQNLLARPDRDLRCDDDWRVQPAFDATAKLLQKSLFLSVRNPNEDNGT